MPVDTPISAKELLSGFVELSQPATRRQIEGLLGKVLDEEKKAGLKRYSDKEVHAEEIVARRISLLDLLEANQEIKMDLGEYLLSLPPLRIRQVSQLLSHKLMYSTRSRLLRCSIPPNARSQSPLSPNPISPVKAISSVLPVPTSPT